LAFADKAPRETAVLQDKVIIVTGAASGIGAAAAQLFAEHGANVMLADIDPTVHAVAQGLPNAAAIVADIADREAVMAMVDASVARFGRLDGAFNNAGLEGNGGRMVPIAEYDAAEFDRVVTVNVRGLFNCLAPSCPR
jgi:NAD(P)-dependent dehydrogenase (short-subunit alcohol dehydrogenase family)